jgi:uncharacterized DUF497 family protein
MLVEWDPKKAASNYRKHRVRFADSVAVLEDERAITLRDFEEEEERWISIGSDAVGRVLVVVYTLQAQRIRIISARRATRQERTQYEEKA